MTMTSPNPTHDALLTAALSYAARGWQVFPLHSVTKDRTCTCGRSDCATGKHPRTPHGVKDATTDPDTIRAWWRQWPDSNVAIACGGAAGLIVVDVDPRNGGAAPAGLPPTLTSCTGGGGQHYLFAAAPHTRVSAHLEPGVDLKGEGGYIVAPPSIHASGSQYVWDSGQPDDPAPCPDWVLERGRVGSSSYTPDPNAEVTRTRLYRMFAAAGMVRGLVGHGRMGVACPWEHEHSSPSGRSEAVVLSGGGWHCVHAHCAHRTSVDVDEWFRSTLPQHYIDLEQEILAVRGVPVPPRQRGSSSSSTDQPRAVRDHNNRLLPTPGNIAMVLAHHRDWAGCLALDTLSGVIRWTAEGPEVPGFDGSGRPQPGTELRDVHATYVAQWFLRPGPEQCVVGLETVNHAIEAAAALAPYDPLVDYLRAVRWDATRRVDTWLTTYLGVADTPAARLAGRLWLISAAARGLNHGCQADHVLVLEGIDQGEGKSQALRILGGDYYGTLPSLRDYPRAASSIRGRWIVEIGELDAIRGSAATTTKDFLTMPSDRYRPAYARREVTAPRSCVFAGTTNESQYLDDPTGSRRYWPVQVGTLDTAALLRDRDLLWAEAVAMYDDHAPWWPVNQAERDMLRVEARERQDEDVWTEHVISAARIERTTSEILYAAVGLEPSRQTVKEAKRCAGILTFHGYKQTRRRTENGERGPRVWVKRSARQ